MRNEKARFVCALVLSAGLLTGFGSLRLAAQGTTGTVLGTVTDSTGGAIPEATVRVTNSGTNATQIVTSDAQGRYRVPDLPVGSYDVETQKTGFQTVDHKGITLNAGADLVVDFSGSTLSTFGQLTSVNGTMRQIQFGSKLLF